MYVFVAGIWTRIVERTVGRSACLGCYWQEFVVTADSITLDVGEGTISEGCV